MKRRKKYMKVVFALFCIILALAGCGKKGSSGNRGAEESDTQQLMAYKDVRYLPVFTDTSEEYSAVSYGSIGVGFVEDTFYAIKRKTSETSYGSSMGYGQLVARDPDSGEERVLWDEEAVGERIRVAAPLGDGSVAVFSAISEDEYGGDLGYRLSRVDSEGKEIFSQEYPDLTFSDGGFNLEFAVDGQGRSYVVSLKEILLFDEQGRASGKVNLDGMFVSKLSCSGKGIVYIYESGSKQLVPIDFEEAKLGKGCPVPIQFLRAIAASGKTDFLVCDQTTVYEFTLEDKNLIPLFDLQDSQIPDPYDLETIGEMKDGRIFLFSNDGIDKTEIALLTPTSLAECPVREVLTIGTVEPTKDLMESVAMFNRQSKDFNVSILNYCIGGRSYWEAVDALKLDYSIGKGPDLCLLDYMHDEDVLMAGGYFADQSAYLESSGQLGREDFLGKALEACTYDGKLMAVPKFFRLQTIVGKTEIVGEDMGWNMEDVKAMVQEHPDAQMIFEDRSSFYMLDVCIRNMMEQFVDFDKGEAHFESAEYIDLLNFLRSLPNNYEGKAENGVIIVNRNECLMDETALLSCMEITKYNDFQWMKQIFGGSYTCIGYPSPDSTPDCIINCLGRYAISSVSSNQDKAWQFIEWSHSVQEPQKELDLILRGGFPVQIHLFEQELQEAMGIDPESGVQKQASQGQEWMTAEEKDLLLTLIEISSPEKRMQDTIIEIMEEEAVSLFEKNKKAEAVAKITQNRVQLYLDEQ